MGRPERPVDPVEGPVAQFAHELRKLRREAGNPTYRTLTVATHYSHSALADAARGTRLPTLEVTQAFVRACGGDEQEWARRWAEVTHQLPCAMLPAAGPSPIGLALPGDHPDSPAAPPLMTETSPPVPQRRVGRWRRDWVLMSAAVAAALAAATGGAVMLVASADSGTSTSVAGGLRVLPVGDGQDPYAQHCGPDQEILEQRPIQWPDGTPYGQVALFTSRSCAGIWGYVYGRTPRTGGSTSSPTGRVTTPGMCLGGR